MEIKIVIYEALSGRKPFEKWFDGLDAPLQRIIATRIDRMSVGNFGDCDPLREGIWELRIHIGPGYRIYFGKRGSTLVIILTAGSKKSQEKDIQKAIGFWQLHKEQHG